MKYYLADHRSLQETYAPNSTTNSSPFKVQGKREAREGSLSSLPRLLFEFALLGLNWRAFRIFFFVSFK